MYRIASALVRLIAPTLVFTAEEVWKFLPRAASDPESVHMASFPPPAELEGARREAREEWDRLLVVREEVLKALEPSRAAKTISSGLEARVTLAADGDLLASLKKYAKFLPALFIVSQVEIAEGDLPGAVAPPGLPGLKIHVSRALGSKCERCWNFSTRVGENSDFPTVCERCVPALEEIERTTGLPPKSPKP